MKTIGCLLGVALALCPFSLKADTWTDENGVLWRYKISSGEATLGLGSSLSDQTAVPKDTAGAITIPATLGGCPVVALSNYAFSGCTEITSVQFPNTVRTFGMQAFYNCTKLTLYIPFSVKELGEGCLWNVPNIELAYQRTVFDANWVKGAVQGSSYYSPINNLYLPSSISTILNFPRPTTSYPRPVPIEYLHIKGPYKNFEYLYACSNRIYYDAAYEASWKQNQKGWICDGSRLSVVSTLHGGTTSDRGRYVTWGEEVSVTATAKEGYVFLGWDSDREGIEGTEETITFTMPQAPVTLVANFFPKALLEGWMDTRIDAKVDGERLMTADQAAEKTAAAIEGKVESGELFTPAGAEAKAAEAIAQKVANKELITADSLQEMALDAPVIEVDASGTAKVGISLQKATSLSGEWQAVELAEDAASVAAGALKLSVPAEEGTAFYKFVVPARQGAQEP